MDPTEDKQRRGTAYLKRLGDRDLLFSGISGSVSYTAEKEDDIDVFLISHPQRMWRTLLRALLLRRFHGDPDICLSLVMDGTHARRLFGGEGDPVMASDAVHVIPVHGADFYRSLLQSSPFMKRHFPAQIGASPPRLPIAERERASVLEASSFVLLGSYLAITSLLTNWRLSRRFGPERSFRVRLSPHYFYLDTEKYRLLRERAGSVPPPSEVRPTVTTGGYGPPLG